ncbi:conserved hypothetical protein [Pseudomonas sp. 8O]|nr:conserved hypothetical protein [Pseudomonas sp. 8O]
MYVPGAILALALVFYFGNFHGGLSDQQSVWGAFGDFIGGILNPVLTFTTVYLLIKSLESQSKTLIHSEAQLNEAKRTFSLQEKTEKIKQFESLFFVFTEIASRAYSNFTIADGKSRYTGNEAVTLVSEWMVEALKQNTKVDRFFEITDEQNHNAIYVVVQGYCSLFKIINEFCPEEEKQKYASISVSLMPSKAIHLVCMAEVYTRWPVLSPARTLGFFEKPAMAGLINSLPRN